MNNKSVLVYIPMKPTLCQILKDKCFELSGNMYSSNPDIDIEIAIDERPIEKELTDYTAWSRVTRARNRMLEAGVNFEKWQDKDFILWIDADVVSYSADLPTRLIAANPTGITAPMILVEGSNRFYDVTAFLIKGSSHIEPTNTNRIKGRNLEHDWPYWPEPQSGIVPVDCVGTITMVPTSLYKNGARYEDHPSYTDHYSICQAASNAGLPIMVDTNTVAYHADLGSGKYPGESWH